MSQKSKNIFIFSSIILLIALIAAWTGPLNKGVFLISAGSPPYTIAVNGKNIICKEDPCRITLKSGTYTVTASKEGYFPGTKPAGVARFKEAKVKFDLKKIPDLTISPAMPKEKETPSIPQQFRKDTVIDPTWDEKGLALVYFDAEDLKIKVFKDDIENIITQIQKADPGLRFSWSPDSKNILGQEGSDLYFIDTIKKTRKKGILEFLPNIILWSPDSNIILANDPLKKLYKIDFAERSVIDLNIELDLDHAAWGDEKELYYFEVEPGTTTINRLDTENGETKAVMTKSGFSADRIISGEKKIFFHNPDEDIWYYLDI